MSNESHNASTSSSTPSTPTLRLVRTATSLINPYIDVLTAGDRTGAKKCIEASLASGFTAFQLLTELVWPAMETIQERYKNDSLSLTQLNLATRLNRFVADLLGSKLEPTESNGKKVLVFCGGAEPEELGGQITADLFEAAGYEVRFGGGGVPDDEVLKLIGEYRPDLLVMFATLPSGVPSVRKLIDYLREVNSNPSMQILCCGGIYKRAEGLAEEIGADLYAPDGAMAVEIAINQSSRRATLDQQTVGRARRSRKVVTTRRPPAPAGGRVAPKPPAEAI